MASLVELMPIKKVWVHILCPTARSGEVIRKKTYSHRKLHAARVAAFSEQRTLLIVETSRRSGGPCQPIKGDLVEYLISTDCFFRISEVSGAGVINIINPGSLACRRIHQCVADGLRASRLHREITGTFAAEAVENFYRALLIWRKFVGDLVRNDSREVQMDRDQAWRPLLCHGNRDERSPVSALRDIFLVTEARHQYRPCLRCSVRVPGTLRGFIRKGETGKRWDNNVECVLGLSAMGGGIG